MTSRFAIEQAFWREGLISPGDKVLAGVSGGGDSVALLCLLDNLANTLPFSLRAIHVHHGIRGEEADRDEELVRSLCMRRGIPLTIVPYDVPSLSREWGMGLEEAGRRCRREAFEREAFLWGEGVKIALAHHMDDQAETVLFHLCRGSGLRGMGGMRPMALPYIRPLLSFRKEELLTYLSDIGEAYATDSTNLLDDGTRNRLRHHILPLLEEEVARGSSLHLSQAARLCALAEDYLQGEAKKVLPKYLLREEGWLFGLSEELCKEHEALQMELLMLCLEEEGKRREDVSLTHVLSCLSLLDKKKGEAHLPGRILCVRRAEGLFFRERTENLEEIRKKRRKERTEKEGTEKERTEKEGKTEAGTEEKKQEMQPGEGKQGEEELLLPIPGEMAAPFGRVRTRLFPYQGEAIPQKKCTKWLDYGKITSLLCIRTRREGDYFFLGQEGGRKLLRRFFIDEKVPAWERGSIPLVAMGSEILLVFPERLSGRFEIGESTEMVLEIEWTDGGEYK